jgi:Holliday junction DNA helicase RuvA
MDADTIANAVISGDEQAFRNIPGVGLKTAKLILLSLAGKVQVTIPSNAGKVLAALRQLGTDETIAREVLAGIDVSLGESKMLKEALKQIGSRK